MVTGNPADPGKTVKDPEIGWNPRYSVADPLTRGNALTLTNPTTWKAEDNSELKFPTVL